MVCSCENPDIVEPVSPDDPDNPDVPGVLPGEIAAGEDGALNFEIPDIGVLTEEGLEIVQESVYTDPDGTVHKVTSVATIDVKVAKDTVQVNDPSGFASGASGKVISSSFDEQTRIYAVSYSFTVGPQVVVVNMQSSEPILENSLGQTVRLPYLKLDKAGVAGVEAVKKDTGTRSVEITDTTDYKVTVSYEIEAELCNVAEPEMKKIAFKVEYDGRTTHTELYPGQQFSYVLEDRDGAPMDYASSYSVGPGEDFAINIAQTSSYEDNKGKVEEQLKAWISLSVSDTLEVVNHDGFIAGLQSAVSIESGFDVSSEGLPYLELSEPELVEISHVDSLDVYPDAAAPATRSAVRRNLYSQTFVVEGELESGEGPQTRSGAGTRAVTADDMYEKYPHVNSLLCPVRIYTAKATYRQTATLRNSEEDYSLELCYDVTVAGKAQVELADVEYDTNGVVWLIPTSLSGECLFNQTTVDRLRIYSTGERLTDHFESNKTMLFGLSSATICAREVWYEPSENWSDADTLGRDDPTLIEALYDDSPYYSYWLYDTHTTYSFEWGAGIDWDEVVHNAIGELSIATGAPFLDGATCDLSGLGFVGNEYRDSQLGVYSTYNHRELDSGDKQYDEDKKIPGWYVGFLQSRHTVYVETGEYDYKEFSKHNIMYPAKMSIDLCFNEYVMCLDDKILVAKDPVDDTSVEYSFESAVSPVYGPVKVAKLNQDVNIYGHIFKFRLTDTLYNYYSPHYEW